MKVKTHKFAHPYRRKIHFDAQVWSWRITREFVNIRSPDGLRTIETDAFEMDGTTYEEWHRVDEPRDVSIDRIYCPPVTPSDIQRIIKTVEGNPKQQPARIGR